MQGVVKLLEAKYFIEYTAGVKQAFTRRKLYQYSATSKNDNAQKRKWIAGVFAHPHFMD